MAEEEIVKEGEAEEKTEAAPNAEEIAEETAKEENTAPAGPAKKEGNGTDEETMRRVMGVLSYLSWLVLIPLIVMREDKTVRRHVNNGLVLAIGEFIWWVISAALSIAIGDTAVGAVLMRILGILNLAFLVFSVIGIVYAAMGKEDDLPVVSKFKILK